jgi:nucleotide-binding universal stress UspA family protein
MKILIAVDESPHAAEALRWAARLGWPAGSEALAFSSIRSDLYVTGSLYPPAAQEIEQLVRAESQRVEAHLQSVLPDLVKAGLKATARVGHGDPRISILDEAKSFGADLLILGSHGRRGLAKLVLGSVATHVVTHAHCSVLVAKLPA